MCVTLLHYVNMHWCPVITSVQELIGNCFYIFLCPEVQKLHSKSAYHIVPCEDITRGSPHHSFRVSLAEREDYIMDYMQELVLYKVIFVPSIC